MGSYAATGETEMKQGQASSSRPEGRKMEPSPEAKHPGGVANLGLAQGNHASDCGTFTPKITSIDAGRGYMAPGVASTSNKSGSQGKY